MFPSPNCKCAKGRSFILHVIIIFKAIIGKGLDVLSYLNEPHSVVTVVVSNYLDLMLALYLVTSNDQVKLMFIMTLLQVSKCREIHFTM